MLGSQEGPRLELKAKVSGQGKWSLRWIPRNWEFHKRDRKCAPSRLGGRPSWKSKSLLFCRCTHISNDKGILNWIRSHSYVWGLGTTHSWGSWSFMEIAVVWETYSGHPIKDAPPFYRTRLHWLGFRAQVLCVCRGGIWILHAAKSSRFLNNPFRHVRLKHEPWKTIFCQRSESH